MPKPRADLTHLRFERLVAICCDGHTPSGKLTWLCICDCGGSVRATVNELRRGSVGSCGCMRRERMVEIGKANWARNHPYIGQPPPSGPGGDV